jgi:hypothetical protein
MAHKFREKSSSGFLCTKYGCKFSDPDFCKRRAENNIDDTCQACTEIQAISTSKSKHSNIVFSTKSMNSKKVA